MARKTLLGLSLVLVAGVIAIVSAQDPGRRMTLDNAQEPAILQVAGEGDESPGTKVARRPRSGMVDRFQSSRRPQSSQDSSQQEPSIELGTAVTEPQSLAPIGGQPSAEMAGDIPSVMKRKVIKGGAPKPIPTPAVPPTEQSTTTYNPVSAGSSRRTASLPRTAPSVPPTETATQEPETIDPAQAAPVQPQFGQPAKPAMRNGGGVLLSNAGAALQLSVTGPQAVVIGKPVPYVVTLVNQSNIVAEDVMVRIVLPPWAVIAATSTTIGNAAMQDEGTQQARFVWSLGQVDARGQHQLNLQIASKEARAFDLNVDWAARPTFATAKVEVQQPQLEMSLTGSKDVQYGENLTYVINLANPGNGDAENVNIKLTAGQGAPETIQVGLIPAGQQKQIEIQLTANQAGAMKISAIASGEGNIVAEVNEQILVRRADLQIAAAGPKVKFAGAEATYQFRVSNVGNLIADEVVASMSLPAGSKVTALTDGGKQTVSGVSWRIGKLAPNTERTFEVHCELTTAGENRVEIRTQATGDLNAAETLVTQVEALADLKLTVNEPKGPRSMSEESLYELTIANRGTKAAEGVQVVMHFSEGLDPIGTDGAQAELVPGQAAFQAIPRIEAGQQVVLKVRAKADRPGNHRFRAEVQCADPDTHLLSEGTSRFFGDDNAPAATPTIRKTSGIQPVPKEQPQPQPAATPRPVPVNNSATGKKR